MFLLCPFLESGRNMSKNSIIFAISQPQTPAQLRDLFKLDQSTDEIRKILERQLSERETKGGTPLRFHKQSFVKYRNNRRSDRERRD